MKDLAKATLIAGLCGIVLFATPTKSAASAIAWTEHIVGDIYTCWSAYASDLDEDGDMDVLGTSTYDHQVAWWENDGSDINFTAHFIADDFDSATSLWVLDLDNDNDKDVISSSLVGTIALWENDGSQNFTQQIIASGLNQVYDTYCHVKITILGNNSCI